MGKPRYRAPHFQLQSLCFSDPLLVCFDKGENWELVKMYHTLCDWGNGETKQGLRSKTARSRFLPLRFHHSASSYSEWRHNECQHAMKNSDRWAVMAESGSQPAWWRERLWETCGICSHPRSSASSGPKPGLLSEHLTVICPANLIWMS